MDIWPKTYLKRISANSNPNLNPTKAQKRFRENELTSFFGQVSRYTNLLILNIILQL